MAWQIEISSNSRIVQVTCSDRISAEDLTMLAIEASFLLKQHGSTRISIDLSKAGVDFSAGAARELLDIYAEYRVPTIVRSAIVVHGPGRKEALSGLLPASGQQGYEVRLFDDPKKAREWLED